jgi:hypothetical protein
MVDTLGVKRRSAPDDAVHLVPFLQQQFRQIGAILSGYAGDECLFHVVFSLKAGCCDRVLTIISKQFPIPFQIAVDLLL